jgi:serine/threonine-protein kinase
MAGTGGTNGSGGATGSGGAVGSGGAPSGGQTGAATFPATAIFYQDISHATVDSESMMVIAALAASKPLQAGVGIDISMTILKAADAVVRRPFTNQGDSPDCDTSPVPLPAGGNIEGSNNYTCKDGGDCHLLVYQGKRLYELYQANISTGMPTGGSFTGGCLVVWDLTHDYWQPMAPPKYGRGDHCNGADAGDIPMAPLILTADDVMSGQVTHAMRFSLPNPNIRKDVYLHPATHIGGPSGDSNQPPYGTRLRLRGDYDLSKLPSDQARAVARALQTYGMFLADGSGDNSPIFISATTDVADVMGTRDLRGLMATDFEMVDGDQRLTWSNYQCSRTVVSD